MQWQDEGIILHTQSLGERKQIVSLFTATHGRCGGVFSINPKNRGWVQCGGKVKARWGARLENHLGHWILEPISTNIAMLLDTPGPLAALLSATSLCHVALPERHAYPYLYKRMEDTLKDLITPSWAQSYVFFELTLLDELGYGLDLKTCAVTGMGTELVAVSPRTGRAVCQDVAQPYQGKLLPLPSFICQKNNDTFPNNQEILDALQLSGYFLERYLLGRTLPSARARLLRQFMKVRKSV
ncbi:MAG: DNA repair protein RecO [Proteobacteria bacterium]|nr:DNA repair protein RecO [Pseudomonadota bacterium]